MSSHHHHPHIASTQEFGSLGEILDAEELDDRVRDFGEVVFGDYGDDLAAFLERVEASLLEPGSRASKYMASVRRKLHADHELAKVCIMTQARVAFSEHSSGQASRAPGGSAAGGADGASATSGTSTSGTPDHPPPPPPLTNPHHVGIVRKQPTQFGASRLTSVAEALAGCHVCYLILSDRSITFVPEFLCDTNPVQTYSICASVQCAHVSQDSNCVSVEVPGRQFFIVADSARQAADWAEWVNVRIDAVHPQGARRKKKPMVPAFHKPAAALPSSPGGRRHGSGGGGGGLSNLSDLVVDQSVIDRTIHALSQAELDAMLALGLSEEQVTCLRLLFDKFAAPGCTFISADSFEAVERANVGLVPNDTAQTVRAAMQESLSVTFAHFLRACAPRQEEFARANLGRFQAKNLQRLRQHHAVQQFKHRPSGVVGGSGGGAGGSGGAVPKKHVEDGSDSAYAAIADAARREAQGTAELMAAPLSQEEAVTLVQRLYRSKMLARRDAAEAHRWHTAYAPTVYVCFRALCDVSMGQSIGLLQCRQGDYLGAKVEDLAASLSGWCRLYDKDLNVGLVSMDHLELISDPAVFEDLLVAQQTKHQEARRLQRKHSHSEPAPPPPPLDDDEDDEDGGGDGGGGGSAAAVSAAKGKPPAPDLPPKRASFKSLKAAALAELPLAQDEPVPDPDHVSMQVSAGTHFGVPLPRAPSVADPRFAYEIPELLPAFEKAMLPHAQTVGLLRISGDQAEYDDLRAALERGERIETSIHTIANLLKIFFRSVPSNDRIFAKLDAQSLISGSVPGAGAMGEVDFKAIVMRLEEPVQSAWWWFLNFAAKLVAQSSVNQMNPTNISTCITPNFFPEFELQSATPAPKAAPKKKKGLFSGWQLPWKKRTKELSNAEKLRKFKMQSRRITGNALSEMSVNSMAQDPVAALKLMQQKNVFVANLITWYTNRDGSGGGGGGGGGGGQ